MTEIPAGIEASPERSAMLRNIEGSATELVLVRHGRTAHNVQRVLQGSSDTPLDAFGLRQAERAAERIARDFPPDAIVSSPLQRALVTATIIGERTGHVPELAPALQEMGFGIHEGRTIAEIGRTDPGVLKLLDDRDNHDIGWPGGEIRRDFLTRIWSGMEEVIEKHPGQRVVVVAHGGVIGAFLALLRGQSPFDPAVYDISNCSLTHLNVLETHSDIHRANDIEHLSGLDEVIELDGA